MNFTALEDNFSILIKEHSRIIYKIANSYCRDVDDRNDLIQEMIIQLWKTFDQYNNKYKFSTWMYRVTLNVAISFYRKEKRKKDYSVKLDDCIIDVIDENTSAEVEEKFNLLHQFIDELTEMNKALIILYLEENSYKEIANILGLTETNVASKISRIKENIRLKFFNNKNE